MKILISGIPASGKSTLGRSIAKKFGYEFIDGIEFRKRFQQNFDFSYSSSEKLINELIKELKNIDNVIVAMVIPWANLRKKLKESLSDYYEIYLKTKEQRYKKRKINYHTKEVPGIDIAYEESKKPDLIVDTDKNNIKESEQIISKFIRKKMVKLNIKKGG